MSDDKVMERLFVGFGWCFIGVLLASVAYESAGASLSIAVAAGIFGPPAAAAAMYVAGVIGVWLLDVADSIRGEV